ncbi:amidohydrolase family protein [Acidaminobacter sp. JC074]|uniref:metal-dependent hydrolase family protein n=1 Tax=Acidaminobacter sp. JC074 TaxID=2530199 RepID=UPI001F10E512|nr:amidohydrolase family protein [Acidaminobacter sp. JC074]MCH4887427.1 amidohydrolase family protein [Acidaminobacter sp. JC074]
MKRAYINANIITGDASDEVIRDGCIIVNGLGKLAFVGRTNEAALGQLETIDLKGRYVMPGLINAHIHMFTQGGPVKNMDSKQAAKFMKFLKTRIGQRVMKKLYAYNTSAFINAGVTTVRDVGSFMNYDLMMKELIEKGEVVGPRIICSGGIITPTGGHGCEMPGTVVCDGPIEFAKAVRHHYHLKTDWIKICNTGGVSDAKYVGEAGMPHMTFEEIQAACTEAHKRNMMVASHCESTEGIIDALRAGVDTIEHGADFDEEIAEMFKNNRKALRGYTSLIPTLAAAGGLVNNKEKFIDNEGNRIVLGNAERISQGCIDGFQKALKYGVKLGMGTDVSVPNVTAYNTYQELLLYKDNSDLTNLEIIELATKANAEVLDIDHLTGCLKVDLDADFIVLKGNPLKDLNNIKDPVHVVTRGYFIEKPTYKTVEGVD